MPTLTQLKEAVAIGERIEKLQAELASLLGGGSTPAVPLPSVKSAPAPVSGKRFVSREARARMAAAQVARWARTKKPGAPAKAVALKSAGAPKTAKGKKKGGLTPEGRARIVAALKARHAANRQAAGL
jgi:hypothetical protein